MNDTTERERLVQDIKDYKQTLINDMEALQNAVKNEHQSILRIYEAEVALLKFDLEQAKKQL